MPDSTGEAPKTDVQAKGTETDSKKTSTPVAEEQKQEAIDTSKLTDEQFDQILHDERALKLTFKHPRFKTLYEQAQAGKKALEEAKRAEEEKLKKAGEYEELLKKKESELEEQRNRYQQATVDNRLQLKLTQAGTPYIEDALKLIDRSTIKTDETGQVSGVEEAVEKLKVEKPFLFSKGSTPQVGSPTNPQPDAVRGTKTFKQSELRNSKFYKENKADIDAAIKAGTIIIGQ